MHNEVKACLCVGQRASPQGTTLRRGGEAGRQLQEATPTTPDSSLPQASKWEWPWRSKDPSAKGQECQLLGVPPQCPPVVGTTDQGSGRGLVLFLYPLFLSQEEPLLSAENWGTTEEDKGGGRNMEWQVSQPHFNLTTSTHQFCAQIIYLRS